MKVDIIIPNYNGSHLIKNNLPQVLKAHKECNGKIIIVDDGSRQDDIVNLRKVVASQKSSKVMLLEHQVNKGFSSAVNTGVKKSDADFVVLLNSDVIPHIDFLQSPLQYMKNDTNLFAVGCMDESVEGKEIVRRGRGIGIWSRGMLHHKKGEIDSEDTFWVSGGSSVFRRELYTLLGGMDEIYNPFYWEDIDLSYRAQKAGFKIIFDKKAVVKHYHDEGSIKTNFTTNKVNVTAYRNQFIFIWKNITSVNFLTNHLLFLPLNLLGALKRGDFNMWKGLFLALAKLPAIIDKRKKQRKYYNVSDVEIIRKIS